MYHAIQGQLGTLVSEMLPVEATTGALSGSRASSQILLSTIQNLPHLATSIHDCIAQIMLPKRRHSVG